MGDEATRLVKRSRPYQVPPSPVGAAKLKLRLRDREASNEMIRLAVTHRFELCLFHHVGHGESAPYSQARVREISNGESAFGRGAQSHYQCI